MRAHIVQIVALLVAVASFALALMLATSVLLSGLLLLVGVAALVLAAGSLILRVNAWGALQRLRERRRNGAA